MIPIINLMHDGVIREKKVIMSLLITSMKLTDEQLEERGKSGTLKYQDNIGFALSYLSMAGLLNKPGRGKYVISASGIDTYNKHLDGINTQYLKNVSPDFKSRIEGYYKVAPEVSQSNHPNTYILNPDEQVEEGARLLKDTITEDLLTNLRNSKPSFLEKVVVKLIDRMGYTYAPDKKDAAMVVGKSHDCGIDGIINEDKLGLSQIYIQAKRYDEGHTVGRPDIQRFIGAMQSRATKGVFITTSSFSKEAYDECKNKNGIKVILIDGKDLVNYMFEYNIGVSIKTTIEVKKLDEDFFDEIESN